MALSMESNWTTAMGKSRKHQADKNLARRLNPKLPTLPSKKDSMPESTRVVVSERDLSNPTQSDRFLNLPPEILLNITSYIPYQEQPQHTLYTASLVSRSWYSAAVSLLYRRPYITGKNFNLFVATVCPSINAHIRKSALADMVKVLDMSNLVHEATKSKTARLLGRLKRGLKVFRAPQASFAINSLAALSKCRELSHLDLSLISEAISLPALFHALAQLKDLTCLHFPRASIEETKLFTAPPQWPPQLRELYISGSLRDTSLPNFTTLPPSLKILTIDRCTNLSAGFIRDLLEIVGGQLEYLRIGWRMPKARPGFLDDILFLAPNLSELDIAMEFLGDGFYYHTCAHWHSPHPLKRITFDGCPERRVLNMFEVALPESIETAIVNRSLHSLRTFRITRRALAGHDDKLLEGELQELGELIKVVVRAENYGRDLEEERLWQTGAYVLE